MLFAWCSAVLLLAVSAHLAGGAEPPQKAADTLVQRIEEIHAFFAQPENRVKIQFPIPETGYAWQNMSRFYPTAVVLRDGPIRVLPEKLDPSVGKITFQKGDKTETVNEHLDNYPVDAFLVVRGGRIVFERYITMRPFDKHNWFSSGKVIGATMLALLEAEGKVDVKKPVSHYLPQVKDSVWDTVTVEETLDMATGLDSTEHDEPNHDSRTNPEQGWFKWAVTLGILSNPAQKETSPYEVMRTMRRRRPGHTLFEYNSIDTFAVNRIVEQITGKPLNEVFSGRVWQKIGAEADAYVAVSSQGYPLHFGMTNSMLRDMARFGMLFTPSWDKVNKERIIPEKVVKMIRTTGRPEIFGGAYVGQKMNRVFPGEKGMTNRYQWDAIFQDGDMYKAGVGGQGLYVSPARDTVIVWFCHGDGNNQEETVARAIAKSVDAG
jgi:CubicO group peptidase (beta-lactamase class C family)